VKTYAGIKGRLLFGAITLPGQPDLVGSSVDQRKLFAFFDKPMNLQDESEAPSPGTTAGDAKPQPESESTEQPNGDKQD
jgi:hypothetical protein